jgi:hypothetical protein
MWYLRSKNYITLGDNSDATLTALGVDFVELNRGNVPVLNRLLTSGTGPSRTDEADPTESLNPSRTPIIVPTGTATSDGIVAKGDKGQ